MDPDEPPDVEIEVPSPRPGAVGEHVDHLMRLLAWSRHAGFRIQSLQVGDVIVNGLRDERPRFGKVEPRGPRDILEEFDPAFYKDAG